MRINVEVPDNVTEVAVTYKVPVQSKFSEVRIVNYLDPDLHPDDWARPPAEDWARPLDTRQPSCVANWPDCENGSYDPRCCVFPKSCSA